MTERLNPYSPLPLTSLDQNSGKFAFVLFFGSATGYFITTITHFMFYPGLQIKLLIPLYDPFPDVFVFTFICSWISIRKRLRYFNLAVPPIAFLIHGSAIMITHGFPTWW